MNCQRKGSGVYEGYDAWGQSENEKRCNKTCFFGCVHFAGSDICFTVVYRTESLRRGNQPVYKDIGIDCHFKYVCISGYLDDQDAVDFPDYGISDYVTYIVSDGWSERRYE